MITTNNDKKEYVGVKRYIRYVRQRVHYIRAGVADCTDNQFNYYISLYRCICEYANTHQLFTKYVFGKLTFDKIKNSLGYSIRNTFRYLEKQRKLFIDFVEQEEITLFAKYPFSDKLTLNRVINYEN